ncbi:unnamed protein product, partial [marine sediment metagenome]
DNNVRSNLIVMPKPSHRRYHMLGHHPSEETKRKLSEITKKQWQNGVYDNRKRRM